MSYFLLIHTSLDKAFVAISKDDTILGIQRNDTPKEHGAFLHVAAQSLLKEQNISFSELTAIGVTKGPGSYTGIRVGLSAAKGFGFALNIPLVVCSTLLALAATATDKMKNDDAVYVPMIHARQSEYYVGFYDQSLTTLRKNSLVRVDTEDMISFPGKEHIFFGIGLDYFAKASDSYKMISIEEVDALTFATLVWNLFKQEKYTKADSAEPLYLKDAFVTISKTI